MFWTVFFTFLAITCAVVGLGVALVFRRNMQRWIAPYLLQRLRRKLPGPVETIHLIMAICDHYEPKAFKATKETGLCRVRTWLETYPKMFARFRDDDGRPPRYTFFFPEEEYEAEYLDALTDLCKEGFGEVEIHLHHQNDTSEGFREKLVRFRELLVKRHGLLAKNRQTGETVYGFIHGNWALCNCRPDKSWCGVDDEIDILLQTGCYADFTFPSAPDSTQPPIVNSIYYAANQPGKSASHEQGVPVGEGAAPPRALLMVQGPLVLDWDRRKLGVVPSIENGCLQGTQLPTIERLRNWVRARIQVPSRPDWFFVKLHSHGAPENAHEALLGQAMADFHAGLEQMRKENPNFHVHYVTAREMANLVKAAEAGFQGTVAEARDYLYVSNLAGPVPSPVENEQRSEKATASTTS